MMACCGWKSPAAAVNVRNQRSNRDQTAQCAWCFWQVAPIPPKSPADGIFAQGTITANYTEVRRKASKLVYAATLSDAHRPR